MANSERVKMMVKHDDTIKEETPSAAKALEGKKGTPLRSPEATSEGKAEETKVERDECEEFKKRAGEWEDKYKRALADYHNLVKRAQDEKTDWGRFANKELLLRFLPVFDTLMLATKHSEDQTLKVTAQQFLDVLRTEGVERIKTTGEEFDPHLMEVIDTIEGDEGKVIEEVRAGYLLHDKLLRVAQVRVGSSSK